MILIENTEVSGWEAALRGMRNPMNSWNRADSHMCNEELAECGECPMVVNDHTNAHECHAGTQGFCVGVKDMKLMKQLAAGGAVHAKYRRMIIVTCDIVAPLYWWKEFDTYKVGTVVNSCSTMHKIGSKAFTEDDFSWEHLDMIELDEHCAYDFRWFAKDTLNALNMARNAWLYAKRKPMKEEAKRAENVKKAWWQMIQHLPSSYNQRRTVLMNYEVLVGIYTWRKDHKQDEWREFCKWLEKLPYAEVITG